MVKDVGIGVTTTGITPIKNKAAVPPVEKTHKDGKKPGSDNPSGEQSDFSEGKKPIPPLYKKDGGDNPLDDNQSTFDIDV